MVFSDADIEQFLTDGFAILRGGFPRELAAEGRAFIWTQVLSWEDCTTWNQPMVHVRKAFGNEPFNRVMNPRLRAALDELMGADRGTIHENFGWWPILFPGFPGPGGWHVDGTNFQHHLTSPEQGLVTLFLFSDVRPGDGGTAVFRGSHHAVARLLAEAEPAGLSPEELEAKLPKVDPAQVIELTGEAGDVAMLHPFLVHGFSANEGTRIRFACNPLYQLKEPMQLERPDGSYSPVEEAIRRALRPA